MHGCAMALAEVILSPFLTRRTREDWFGAP